MDLQQRMENAPVAEFDAWFEFKGVPMLLPYMERSALNRIIERSKKRTWNRKHQAEETLDDDRLQANLAGLIKDWKMTLADVVNLLPIELAEGDNPKAAVECTLGNKLALLKGAYGLDDFLIEAVTDLQQFREEKLAREKKTSEPLPGS